MATEATNVMAPGVGAEEVRRIGTRVGALRSGLRKDFPRWVVISYGVVAVLVAAYVISVAARGGSSGSFALDGWGVAALELLMSLLCLGRLTIATPALRGRGVALALGAGLMSWATGDLIVAAQFGSSTPAAAQVCYLGFYPLTYMAVVLLMRQEVTRFPAPTWLDGALAGLGAAAVCAAFAFRDLLHSAGTSAFATALNVAYPIGDLLLLALVVGGTAMLPGRRRVRWILLASACTLNAVGDTFNLLHNSVGASAVGQAFNATAWPVAILLMSIAIWMRTTPPVGADQSFSVGFVLPGLSAMAGLVILTVGSLHPVGRIALGLAATTLVVAGLRLALSVGALRSVTEQRHRQSLTDELTGLGNRRHLSQVFESLISVASNLRTPEPPGGENGASAAMAVPSPGLSAARPTIAVLFVDLDRFKEVNDSFGHSVGDELLRQIGPRLAGALRSTDTLVRLGGDEFAVVLPSTDEEQAVHVAERIAAKLEQPFYLDVIPVQISASIGIAMAPRDGADLAEILRCADSAMYRAKLSHGQVQAYDHSLDDSGHLLQLAEELREAVDNGGLVLHFQPQLDLKTGVICAVEALLRWEHPQLGTIAPLKFLPLAEESGLMPAITEYVLNEALAQCARWRATGHDLSAAVNISASNLLDTGFAAMVSSAVERSGVPPSALVLEITETCIISDYERSRAVIDELQQLGIVMSIDDFGAGFTSLAHLSNLAVGELKLDRSFIAPLDQGCANRDVEIVRSTIGLGHALGLRVVAEGIETDATLDLLAEFGCDIAQGYLISRPVSVDRLDLMTLGAAWRSKAATGEALGTAGERGTETNEIVSV